MVGGGRVVGNGGGGEEVDELVIEPGPGLVFGTAPLPLPP